MQYELTKGQLNGPAEAAVVESLSAALGIALPHDYLDFLRQHNGGEGFIGESYIVLWKAEEIALFNREYEVAKYAPGILMFGSNGGGDGYGFDIQQDSMPVICMPFIGMERRYADRITASFTGLFTRLRIDF